MFLNALLDFILKVTFTASLRPVTVIKIELSMLHVRAENMVNRLIVRSRMFKDASVRQMTKSLVLRIIQERYKNISELNCL